MPTEHLETPRVQKGLGGTGHWGVISTQLVIKTVAVRNQGAR